MNTDDDLNIHRLFWSFISTFLIIQNIFVHMEKVCLAPIRGL